MDSDTRGLSILSMHVFVHLLLYILALINEDYQIISLLKVDRIIGDPYLLCQWHLIASKSFLKEVEILWLSGNYG